MYALVALGYVLIYKASGVFNYAQGSMVFLAALTTVGLAEYGHGTLARRADDDDRDGRSRAGDRADRAATRS
jgi:hypothetical protein